MTRLWIIFLIAVAMATASSFFLPATRERPGILPGYQCPTRHSSVVRKSQKPRLADRENSVQELRARNNEALSTKRKITQGISPVLKQFPGTRAGLPSLQPTAVAQTGPLSRLKIDFLAITPASEVSRPFGSFCSKLASYFKQPRRSGGRCRLQTQVHNNSTPNRPAPPPPPRTTFLKVGLGQNRYRVPIPDTERGPKTGSTRSRPVSEQSFSSPQTRRDFTSSDQPQWLNGFL